MDIGLYIHWPFCTKKCNYCDLNSHVRNDADYLSFVDSLCIEIDYWKKTCPHFVIKTIFFGGGTPSLMKVEWIERILQVISRSWECDLEEVTLEANPATAECAKLSDLRRIGIDRISFGVQSFDDNLLSSLGRTHTSSEALRLIREAQKIFEKVSIDLMYSLPNQDLDILQSTLNTTSSLNLKHVSWYALTIEKNTVFGNLYEQKKLVLPNDDEFCLAYNLIVENMTQMGLDQYEISNFALPGHESRHNLIYWEYKDFLGVGPGAHSRLRLDVRNDLRVHDNLSSPGPLGGEPGAHSRLRLDVRNDLHVHDNLSSPGPLGGEPGAHSRLRLDRIVAEVENHKLPEAWLAAVNKNHNGSLYIRPIDQEIILQEELIMKLRLKKGLNHNEIARLFRHDIDHKVTNLVCTGDIVRTKDGFNLTSYGFLRYNAVLRYLDEVIQIK